VSDSVAGKSTEHVTRFILHLPGGSYLLNVVKVSKVSAVLRRSLLTVGAVLIGGTLVPSIHAASMDPVAFINALGDQLQVVTRNRSPEQTLRGLRELLREDFDVPALGRFVLGRFWRIFTPSEKQEFLELFENYVVFTYSERLIEYCNGGTSLRVTGSRPDPDGTIVISELTRGSGAGAGKRDPSAQPIRVDWRLSTLNGGHKITDIIIDGLSMAANGRSQLEGVVQRNGGRAQAILAVMRQQTASASAR
jgi:phospholipid transport system substrate-binding protein